MKQTQFFFSHFVFALTFVALGMMSFVGHNFAPLWSPVSASVLGRDVLITASACISVLCGVGMLWKPVARHCAGLLVALLVAWILTFRVPTIVPMPMVAAAWESGLTSRS